MRTRTSIALRPATVGLRADIRQRICGPLAQRELDRCPFGPHLPEPEQVGAVTRHDDEIHPRGQEPRPQAEALPAKPPDPVSTDRVPRFSGDDKTQARRPGRKSVRRDEQRKVRRSNAPTISLLFDEFSMPSQSTVRPKSE